MKNQTLEELQREARVALSYLPEKMSLDDEGELFEHEFENDTAVHRITALPPQDLMSRVSIARRKLARVVELLDEQQPRKARGERS